MEVVGIATGVAMEGLNWLQRYAGEEVVERARDGELDRREMLRRLIGICGSAAAATAFLAACGDDTSDSADLTTVTQAPPQAPGTTLPASGTSAPSNAATGATAADETGAGETLAAPPTNAASPLLAVAADDPDVVAEPVELPGPAGTVFAYVAQPADPGSRAGVLVVHEIFGLNDHIRDVARRLAKAGYLALAVDLASRAGGTAEAGDVAAALTQGPIEDRIADLDAGLAYLEAQPEYNGRLGVTGFCFGGGMTLSYAAAQPKVRAAVPYYGPTPQPAEQMSQTNAAILAQYGADDERVNAGIPALEEALAGKTFETRIYEGAGHAFNNDTRDSYVEDAAVAAWTATLEWFATHLA
jgi:carboxymethylenebutenolidase